MNLLADPRDLRLPRMAGPSAIVLFGATGDLATKKLIPAIYDLANRGLLAPGSGLVGFARRDWAAEHFQERVAAAVKEYSRTGFREDVWKQLLEGIRFVGGDLSDADAVASYPWREVDTVINAAAWTAVDLAETPDGRRAAWAANVTGVANLCRAAAEHRLRLVHVSTDYVFDGTAAEPTEDEALSPLGVYGQTKAAGDALVGQVPRHHLVRTSWVIGDGKNFVRTMAGLAASGKSPSVVDDQFGRLTFTADLAAGIVHLLTTGAPSGTYNLTNDGPVASWCEIARAVFELSGRDPSDVTPISTADYTAGTATAPRPVNSALALAKLKATGFTPSPWPERLRDYLREERP